MSQSRPTLTERSQSMLPKIVIDQEVIFDSLRRSNPQGGTNILSAIASAMAATGRAVAEASHQVIVFTDGDAPAPEEVGHPRRTASALMWMAPRPEALPEGLSPAEALKRLREQALLRDPETWAGEDLGPKKAAERIGVSRSTLDNWRTAGLILVIPKGRMGHLVPLAQFDGRRPLAGLDRVIQAAGPVNGSWSAVLWLWLTLPNAVFSDRTPLDLLRQGQSDDVVQAAAAQFAAR